MCCNRDGAQAPPTTTTAYQGIVHVVHGPVSLDEFVRAAQQRPVVAFTYVIPYQAPGVYSLL
eukprot:5008087-Lingulodinium_polyedra.AAC.1